MTEIVTTETGTEIEVIEEIVMTGNVRTTGIVIDTKSADVVRDPTPIRGLRQRAVIKGTTEGRRRKRGDAPEAD